MILKNSLNIKKVLRKKSPKIILIQGYSSLQSLWELWKYYPCLWRWCLSERITRMDYLWGQGGTGHYRGQYIGLKTLSYLDLHHINKSKYYLPTVFISLGYQLTNKKQGSIGVRIQARLLKVSPFWIPDGLISKFQ